MSVIALFLLVALLIPDPRHRGGLADRPSARPPAGGSPADAARPRSSWPSGSSCSRPRWTTSPAACRPAGRERVPPATARRSVAPLHPPTASRFLTAAARRARPARGDGGAGDPPQPAARPGPAPGLRALLRHLGRRRRVQRGLPDPQLPAEPVRRRRALGVVHPGLRPPARPGRATTRRAGWRARSRRCSRS